MYESQTKQSIDRVLEKIQPFRIKSWGLGNTDSLKTSFYMKENILT